MVLLGEEIQANLGNEALVHELEDVIYDCNEHSGQACGEDSHPNAILVSEAKVLPIHQRLDPLALSCAVALIVSNTMSRFGVDFVILRIFVKLFIISHEELVNMGTVELSWIGTDISTCHGLEVKE